MSAKDTLLQWIGNGDLGQTLHGLEIVNNKQQLNLEDELTIQKSRYILLEANYRKGILSSEAHSVELTKIRYAVLQLIHQLPEQCPADGLDKVPRQIENILKSSTHPLLFLKRIGYIALAAVALFSVVKVLDSQTGILSMQSEAMQLTVFVQGNDGKPVAALQNKGQIIVDFGNDRRAPLIGENGRTNLGEIPEKFRGKQISIVLQAEGFEASEPTRQFLMDGNPIYFSVKRDNSLGLIQGIVKDRTGSQFIPNALVMVDQDTTVTTDSLGRFKLVMPIDKQADTYSLTIKKAGYNVANEYYRPNTGPKEIRLTKTN